ncbi:hypothetical protein OZ411_06430 [Bradyrhizobium sp. Arg237L]|uniref:hypothetical protein n=1 Tax=Bradyrhizobium sp. Arg237L TaxID=3003352 RepID=UPI00249EF178|nr:hypothetical protein [Bradyrhizobium sp. Arg237L]MDI4232448.1 hypothetical protein [Bradyrhizobium sp. Arg237L]
MIRDWLYRLSIYWDEAWTYFPEDNARALARWLLARFVVTLAVVIGSAVVYMIVQAWDRNDEVVYQLIGGLLVIYFLVFAGYFIFGIGKFAIRLSQGIWNGFRD